MINIEIVNNGWILYYNMVYLNTKTKSGEPIYSTKDIKEIFIDYKLLMNKLESLLSTNNKVN